MKEGRKKLCRKGPHMQKEREIRVVTEEGRCGRGGRGKRRDKLRKGGWVA